MLTQPPPGGNLTFNYWSKLCQINLIHHQSAINQKKHLKTKKTLKKKKTVPKLGLTINQYLWCWFVIVAVGFTVNASYFNISGLFIYLYVGSISLATIYLLIKFAGRSRIVFALSLFEVLAILLQLAACYANLTKEVNWFHANYRDILSALYELEVLLLTIAGIYGFALLAGSYCWRLYTGGSDSSHKSHVYPLLHERRGKRR